MQNLGTITLSVVVGLAHSPRTYCRHPAWTKPGRAKWPENHSGLWCGKYLKAPPDQSLTSGAGAAAGAIGFRHES